MVKCSTIFILAAAIAPSTAAARIIVEPDDPARCAARSSAVTLRVELLHVELLPALETIADLTCSTFVVEGGLRATVTINASPAEASKELTGAQLLTRVVTDLRAQDVAVTPEGPNRFRLRRACSRPDVVSSDVRVLDATTRELNGAALDRLLGNLNCVARGVRIFPAYRDGVSVGFMLRNIQSGSSLDLLGLRSGDVVRAVMEVPLKEPEAALHVYERLRRAETVQMDIDRLDKPTQLTWRIQRTGRDAAQKTEQDDATRPGPTAP